MSNFKESTFGDNPKSNRVWSGSIQLPNLSESEAYNTCTAHEQKSDRKNKSLLGRSKRNSEASPFLDEDMLKTKSKLFNANFNHHDPELCVCDSCTCGRHLCSFKNVKADMGKASIYNKSFNKKTPIPNNINHSKEYDQLQGPHIAMESRHRKEYQGKTGDVNERRRPQDLLKVGGPAQQLTSYSSGFPGFKGSNQYVKPTDNMVRADFPMRARSTYSNSFVNTSAKKPVKEKMSDNLKSTNLWLGNSTYGNFYQQPNPQDYAPKAKNTEKLEINPNYNKQFETTYKKSFLGEPNNICPSKKLLETKSKGVFNDSKGRFTENSDFKSLNPNFHAISTSKHFYV